MTKTKTMTITKTMTKTKILLFVGTNKEFGEYLKELGQIANTDLTASRKEIDGQ